MAGALAAVDMQDLAGDEARPFEIKDRPDDVVDLTHTPDRMHCRETLVGRGRMQRRPNVSGRECVHADATSGVLDGERSCRRATKERQAPW